MRIDYNLSTRHQLSNMSYNFNDIVSRPDTTNTQQTTFPGFPITGDQISDRYTFQTSLRSTLGANLVNEVRVRHERRRDDVLTGASSPEMWNGPLANQGGYALGISAAGITNAGGAGPGISSREALDEVHRRQGDAGCRARTA